VGGTPELISHGERGFLFQSGNLQELANALRVLTADPVCRQRMANAAARFVHENLTIEIAAARLASIYKKLLGYKDRLAVPTREGGAHAEAGYM
jgi:glycosyltransferase involved in cell wall biosynthesis